MEPIDNDFKRYEALSLAVQHAQGRLGRVAVDVLYDAEIFLNWLNNTENNSDPTVDVEWTNNIYDGAT